MGCRGNINLAVVLTIPCVGPAVAQPPEVSIGERPAIEAHVDQRDIDSGELDLTTLTRLGRRLFDARFNVLDGQGRPGSTGTGEPRTPDQPAFVRTSAPDANSCAGCHNQPASGGAGDIVANVFVLAQAHDPVTLSVAPGFSNERNTLGMFGAGPIEMLAREMTAELIGIRERAQQRAAATRVPVTERLEAKGIDFGRLTVMPDGRVDPTEIEGVDWDLVIKPFHQKGAVVSLREFTNNAMNHHHGMQSVERFGAGMDPDLDGVVDELSIGDVTAVTLFQAALPAPGYVRSKYPQRHHAAVRGGERFVEIGCGSCHVPALELTSRYFEEPNPFNPPGNLQVEDVPDLFRFDMAAGARGRHMEKLPGGGVRVRAFTDLKRHDLSDGDFSHFANEQLPQGSLAGTADPATFTVVPSPRPTREFLTRKLWDAGDSAPYGHRGDLTTLTEAIHFHGGEAREQRDRFFELPGEQRDQIIEFLRSMKVTVNGMR